jgi:GT2 family glycosyltransferase
MIAPDDGIYRPCVQAGEETVQCSTGHGKRRQGDDAASPKAESVGHGSLMSLLSIKDLTAVIPVYNGGFRLEACLSSVLAAGMIPRQVVVVADGESDGSWRVAQDLGMRVVRLEDPGGPARARNRGAAAAESDILLFIDADVTLAPQVPQQFIDVFNLHPEVAAVIGSYDNEPAETNFLSQYKNLLHHYVHQVSRREAVSFWGACGAIRREAFLILGGFDESYRHPSIEDIELGYRLKRAGYPILLERRIQVKHLKRWGFFNLLRADFFFRALPWSRLILREGRFPNDLNLTFKARLSVGCLYLLIVSLATAAVWPSAAFGAAICVAGLAIMNWSLYRFFWKLRGGLFTLKVVPWHWLYLFYSGLAFGLSTALHLWTRFRTRTRPTLSNTAADDE